MSKVMGRVSFTEVPFPSMEVGKGGEGRGEGKGEGKGGEREGKEGEKEGKKGRGKKGGKKGELRQQWGPLGKARRTTSARSKRSRCPALEIVHQRAVERSSTESLRPISVFQGAARSRREMRSSIEWWWFEARSWRGCGDMSDFSLWSTFGRASFWEG